MQIDDDRPTNVPRRPGEDATRKEILTILAESGFAPAQGIEAMIERLLPGPARQ